jgi:hypothetical protein
MTTEIDLPHLRLLNPGLNSSPFQSPDEVVKHLGAVQAQDIAAALLESAEFSYSLLLTVFYLS